MELNKEEFAAVVDAHSEILEWASNRLDSLLGRTGRWPLMVEIPHNDSDSVEFTWQDRDGDFIDRTFTWAELTDETNETWETNEAERKRQLQEALEQSNRQHARTSLEIAKQNYLRAVENAKAAGVLREVDTSKML